MPTTLTNGIQLPDKGSVDWYGSMQSNYNLIDTHLGDTDVHVTAEDKARWDGKQGSLSQAQLDAIAQVATNTSDITALQSGKADASHTHSSSDITDIGDYATKQYVDNSISGLVDNAPDALNTLNELSAALNDDSNFASTVTTALATKANSADLATVATSGSYTDLTDKPTINDSTITIQKNGSTVDTFTTNGSNKTINITVPTNTSDLTNDSNFIDISNAAVASGITSAKVTDYDTHIADTDIHVTTADKNRWNNQTFVFRYSSTVLTASSTNSNALLDNTDNLKVGDKVIDSDGVLFSITAIDTANSTFTIGTALIDLAQDSDVVHKSGNETVGGEKTFDAGQINVKSTIQEIGVIPQTSTLQYMPFMDKNNVIHGLVGLWDYDNGASEIQLNISDIFKNGVKDKTGTLDTSFFSFGFLSTGVKFTTFGGQLNNSLIPLVNSTYDVGSSSYKWKSVYATNYYYGSNNVEFSTKFVTTDTDQTISGNKTFGNGTLIVNNSAGSNIHGEIKLNGSRPGYIVADSSYDNVFNNANCGISILLQDAGKPLHIGGYKVDSNGRVFADNTNKTPVLSLTSNLVKTTTLIPENDTSNCLFRILSELNYANGNPSKTLDVRFIQYDNADASNAIYSNDDGKTSLGVATKRWSDVITNKVNGVEPSSLSLPNLANGIDISSYITDLTGNPNTYSPPANGYIAIRSTTANVLGIVENTTGMGSYSRGTNQTLAVNMPVVKNSSITIYAVCSSLSQAKFIPCQGNV